MTDEVAEKLPDDINIYYEQVGSNPSIKLNKNNKKWFDKGVVVQYMNTMYDKQYKKQETAGGGFKIRKTIKKKYRKSKFITRKIKKKIILKKPRTLKRKYKRIL